MLFRSAMEYVRRNRRPGRAASTHVFHGAIEVGFGKRTAAADSGMGIAKWKPSNDFNKTVSECQGRGEGKASSRKPCFGRIALEPPACARNSRGDGLLGRGWNGFSAAARHASVCTCGSQAKGGGTGSAAPSKRSLRSFRPGAQANSIPPIPLVRGAQSLPGLA